MAERVVVLGAGIAGLSTALALAPTRREITLLERDAPPPDGGTETAFDAWNRRGATQLRHSHAFLARLRKLIGDEHPALLTALRDAGARELRFADGLPAPIQARYVPSPDDEEMAIIVSRRTTLETVIRGYVEQAPNVTIRSGVFVTGLVSERDGKGRLVAKGLALEDQTAMLADIVVDAGGRRSPMADWLADAGLTVPEEAEDCAILYYTRFYRLVDGMGDPPRGRFAPTGDLGFLKFGVFPADNGTFSITMAVPEVEEALRAAVVRPEIFEAICNRLPGVAPWTDPARSEPVSKVHAMGDLQSRWRDFAAKGATPVLGLFSVGDSLVRTNPLFGRGCSFASIEAHILRDVLEETGDPAKRLVDYATRVRKSLRPFYEDMRSQDRTAARRARNGLDEAYKPPLRARLMKRFIEDGVTIALREDVDMLREAMRAFHMLAPPRAWLGRPANLAKVFAVMARGRKANAHLYADKPGPGRLELLTALGLPTRADLGPMSRAA